ncbi:MAG: 50S ribosomal protein L29 [Planctomycetes bacterium RIFCSPHIGHO2_02_FULL_50_42]|jgi:large subunit ribosomal protein L29|uniref:Large ribosomal subunit protein uL29 n=1 Tax=uncultured planctomycete Rifle_16ft_4_minimus_3099 TaxID=1665203 RepID=A0A0H4T5I0_9BACT|nr:50S ribosomal protein L29, large subunit ribosomal protein L29 [uncultured planctomycete Rifle_16ft_4_minimus_3099]OHB37110.1 MAG: 50S ribosomal protein L29 [Planctomycetes bacterium GWA2_50_13]OHB89882.1 MAG: 50S ribosomal protein L29 [Planctomycetes bacterium RIFCSPHIGHO2_02_FULL_50_42]OHB91409.1 MAG: 50S ribosomal protein L29 [Planctomycetes bacterium RIFCSPHIGHO2_12_FULL_51_37]OHB95523.1 MAG: 50S ribosomal protein L29 [Planctomycetes bacterium RIFCSPLOWO2_02_FULL_50_16]OHC05172.1 MAG: 5
MKPGEIRTKLREDILAELEGSKRELLNLRIQWQAGELKNSAQYAKTRKKIARTKTILREMDLGINKRLYSGETKKQ